MVIDFHVHAFPDNIAIKAMPSLAETANTIPYTDGTVSGVLDSMKTAGVDKSCILSIATKEGQTEKITDWAHNINSDFNNITAFGSVHPEYKNFKSEIKRMKSLGIKGVKFHPDYQMFFVDDKKMYPIYKELIENEMIIVFHAGLDIGLPAPYHCTPLRLKKVLDAFPDNKIIAAHMGGFSYWDDVEKYLMGTNCFLDTSYTLGYIDNKRFIDIIRKHGVEKILFATDSPWKDQKTELTAFNALDLEIEEKELILSKNASKLLAEK